MNEDKKRKDFISKFTCQVDGIKSIKTFINQINELTFLKFQEENDKMKPTMGELADGYRQFILDLGEGFLEIVENYNSALEIAKENDLIKNVKLKARIKDFSSSIINTDKKMLDDVFGIEIITGSENKENLSDDENKYTSEKEKEILMLFNHYAFNISKNKKYNKETGYEAYHCMGDFVQKNEEFDTKCWIIETVKGTKTREYKRSKSEPNYTNKKYMVDVFPILKEIIDNPIELNKIVNTFEQMMKCMKKSNKPIVIPIIEFHFLTKKVSIEAIKGKANHSRYKNTDEKVIKEKFAKGELIRGINSPWKFEGTENGIELQDFYTTLFENWPFLNKIIEERKKMGKEEKDKSLNAKFDYLTAFQYPFLRKYIPSREYPEKKRAELWGILKAAMVVNRLDETKSLEDELVSKLLEL